MDTWRRGRGGGAHFSRIGKKIFLWETEELFFVASETGFCPSILLGSSVTAASNLCFRVVIVVGHVYRLLQVQQLFPFSFEKQ